MKDRIELKAEIAARVLVLLRPRFNVPDVIFLRDEQIKFYAKQSVRLADAIIAEAERTERAKKLVRTDKRTKTGMEGKRFMSGGKE